MFIRNQSSFVRVLSAGAIFALVVRCQTNLIGPLPLAATSALSFVLVGVTVLSFDARLAAVINGGDTEQTFATVRDVVASLSAALACSFVG